MSALSLLVALGGLGWGQAPPPPGGDSEPAGSVAVAVAFPAGVEDVQVTATLTGQAAAVLLSDDGTGSYDAPGDGEHWALLEPPPKGARLSLAGTADGLPLLHEVEVTVPPAWQRSTYPVVFIAIREGQRFRLEPILSSARPHFEGGQTGAGLGGWSEGLGFSASALYLLWGAVALTAGSVAALAAAIGRRAAPTR